MSHAEVQEFSSDGLEGNVAFPGDKPVRWGAADKGGWTKVDSDKCE